MITAFKPTRLSRRAVLRARAPVAALLAVVFVAATLVTAPPASADGISPSTPPTNNAAVSVPTNDGRTVTATWQHTSTTVQVPLTRQDPIYGWVTISETLMAHRVLVEPWSPIFPGVIAFPGYAHGGNKYLFCPQNDCDYYWSWEYRSYEDGSYTPWFWTGDTTAWFWFAPQSWGWLLGRQFPVFDPPGSFQGNPGGAWYTNFVNTSQVWPNHYCDEQVRWWVDTPWSGIWLQCGRLDTVLVNHHWRPVGYSAPYVYAYQPVTTTTDGYTVSCSPAGVGASAASVSVASTPADFTLEVAGSTATVRTTGPVASQTFNVDNVCGAPPTTTTRPLRPT
jgi:hypothetical protein